MPTCNAPQLPPWHAMGHDVHCDDCTCQWPPQSPSLGARPVSSTSGTGPLPMDAISIHNALQLPPWHPTGCDVHCDDCTCQWPLWSPSSVKPRLCICHSLSPYQWCLLILFVSSNSSSFQYVPSQLDTLFTSFWLFKHCSYQAVIPHCSSFLITRRGIPSYSSLLITTLLSVDSFLHTIQFYCIGYVFLLAHLISTCSITFYAYAYSDISSLLHILYSSFLIYII